jgi:hypothetical protein
VYLRKYGHKVLDNGFEVIAILPGKKFPNYDFSHETLPKITHKRIDKWLSNGHAKDGIGIRTKFTPFVDIDCPNKTAREKVIAFVENLLGYAPLRIGDPRKAGLVFRADEPFTKVQSQAYEDPKGRKCQVEIMGDGQQFVAFGIHPETKKPYVWPDKGLNPVRMTREELPSITKEQAEQIKDYFDKYCIGLGWSVWGKNKPASMSKALAIRGDYDDIGGNDATPVGLDIETVREWVEKLPNDDSVGYEDQFGDSINYRNVIFAIWHETNGSPEGREIALEWSRKNESKHGEDPQRFRKLWRSADPADMEQPVTFRYVIKHVLTIEQEAKRELRDSHIESLVAAQDIDSLKVTLKQVQQTNFDPLDFNMLAAEVKRAFHRLRSPVTPAQARKFIEHKPAADELPDWVQEWVYIQHTKRFFNTETGASIEREAFDATYSRYLDGASAAHFALNVAQIKSYWNLMYKPDADREFVFDGHLCYNNFSDRLMPPMPEKYSKGDRHAISVFENHCRNILPNKRKRAILISFLSYIVKTHDRPNWTIILQGVDGDGKSYFGELMGAVLGGPRNVRKLDPQQLEAQHTGWAVGQMFCFIEEMKVPGHSRFDVMNKIKPFITNPSINVHPKNIEAYTALNTTAYFCTTNFGDAIPLGDNDRRWCVIMSKWQTGEAIRKFEADNPNYFEILFSTLNSHSGTLRKYLYEYELHKDFHPKGRAPITDDRERMISASKSDVEVALEDALEDDTYPQIGPELIVASALVGHVVDSTGETLKTRQIGQLLSSRGYVKLPFRVRLETGDGSKDYIWVKNLKSFSPNNLSDQRTSVMKFLRRRARKIEADRAI